MKIAILGAGNVGGNLVKALSSKGHTIVIGSRDPNSEKVQALVQSNSNLITATDHKSAILGVDAIIISTHPPTLLPLLSELGDLGSTPVIDTFNSLFERVSGYDSATEAIKAKNPNTPVAKAFNTFMAQFILNPIVNNSPTDHLICGDEEAKKVAMQLSEDIGFHNLDAGDIKMAHSLEEMTRVLVNLVMNKRFTGPTVIRFDTQK
jgi:8-hydroxy-5-deazaflavin:NADPH oxidoreductase